ncbi:MAG: nucleotidyltransferase domain-containing protein [Candidatus Gracilibacteria bacterium]|jgi:predicted nucleotidyltransferase|nr:nucleotidyltransferase domain-containing protein [Candidatus Gracilibacteria bacterium]
MNHSKQLKTAYDIAEQESKKEGVIAISVFGSVAEGSEKEDSDLDIEIISENAKEWNYKTLIIDGVYVDLVTTPKDFLLRRIKEYPYLNYTYLHRKTIYDPTKFLRNIENEVKEYFEKNPEATKFWKEKKEYVKRMKSQGKKPESAMKSYDEAEINFSENHQISRDFFKSE